MRTGEAVCCSSENRGEQQKPGTKAVWQGAWGAGAAGRSQCPYTVSCTWAPSTDYQLSVDSALSETESKLGDVGKERLDNVPPSGVREATGQVFRGRTLGLLRGQRARVNEDGHGQVPNGRTGQKRASSGAAGSQEPARGITTMPRKPCARLSQAQGLAPECGGPRATGKRFPLVDRSRGVV